jgi:hypothetical protein
VRTIHLTEERPDAEVDALAGTLLGEDAFDLLIQNEDVEVYKPNGDLLLRYIAKALPLDLCGTAFYALRGAAGLTMNRGMAAGKLSGNNVDDWGADKKQAAEGTTRFMPVRKSGYVSNTVEANPVHSGIIGYFDRTTRMPYCRMTAFNIDHYDEFSAALPFVQAVNQVFKANAPERYEAQLAMISKTNPDFYIKDTAFTTITVNSNFRTAVHKDAGDLAEGMGVLSALEGGSYRGGYLTFPKYRVAVDLRTQGVVLCDVHEWHGNTPIQGRNYERISCVFYYRAKMAECGSAEDELDRAKNRAPGDPIRG